MSISAWIAKVGANPIWIAANAHCWFAYAFTFTLSHWLPLPLVAGTAVVVAAVKEFYFDKHFEANQHFLDNATDLGGYCLGVLLAIGACAVTS